MPAVVDLACMRDAMNNLGGDPNKINPLVSLLLYICIFSFLLLLNLVQCQIVVYF